MAPFAIWSIGHAGSQGCCSGLVCWLQVNPQHDGRPTGVRHWQCQWHTVAAASAIATPPIAAIICHHDTGAARWTPKAKRSTTIPCPSDSGDQASHSDDNVRLAALLAFAACFGLPELIPATAILCLAWYSYRIFRISKTGTVLGTIALELVTATVSKLTTARAIFLS